ncbi:hypothetical protein ABZ070_09520, partial [Streptomyces sp. NPDC006283]|uniref:hypothetical protein n=1 Tax=Streptomyces sp. NPDC006283 TaxID=3156741 RepID=UPI0033AB255B
MPVRQELLLEPPQLEPPLEPPQPEPDPLEPPQPDPLEPPQLDPLELPHPEPGDEPAHHTGSGPYEVGDHEPPCVPVGVARNRAAAPNCARRAGSGTPRRPCRATSSAGDCGRACPA